MPKTVNTPKGKKFIIESSKLLLLWLLSGYGIVTLSILVLSFLLQVSDPLVTLIESHTKLCAIAVGFYFWKAKCENMQKYKHTDKIGEIEDAKGY